MRVKSFEAATMAQAMERVRVELGEYAILLSSEAGAGGKGVRVTAALEEDDGGWKAPAETLGFSAPPEPAVAEAPTPSPRAHLLRQCQEILGFHSVPLDLHARLEESLSRAAGSGSVTECFTQAFAHHYRFTPIAVRLSSEAVMLVGPPGVGKTITIAKLAAQTALAHIPTLVVTTDSERAGGVAQLKSFTDLLKVPLVVAETSEKLRKILATTDKRHAVFIDSGGVNPYHAGALQELGKLVAAGAIEPILTCSAGMDCAEAAELATSFRYLGAERLLITKVDTARRYGSLLTAADSAGLSFAGISRRPFVGDEVETLTAAGLAELVLAYGRRFQDEGRRI
jgi:flagellar biosynthesis protein FlhF